MKNVFLLCFLILLPACSVYTLTNKTGEDIKFKRAGDESMEILRAGECVELSEYFVGLESDFPFVVMEGKDAEYKPNNYEITVIDNVEQSDSELRYNVSESDKNPDCKKTGEGEKIADVSKMVPMCENDNVAKCNAPNSEVKCIKKENNEIGPVCLNNKEGNPINGVNPVCGETQKSPVCKEKQGGSSFVIDEKIQALCLNGNAVCQENNESKCVREGNKFIPVCLENNRKVEEAPYCPDDNAARPKCISNVVITVEQGASVFCGSDRNAHCGNSGARVVCGSIPANPNIQPYCVNTNNIRWDIEVLCNNSVIAHCQ